MRCVSVDICAVAGFLQNQLIPHVVVFYFNLKLRREIRSLEQQRFSLETPEEEISDDLIVDFKTDYDKELDRRNRIVDRGRSGLFIIGVTIAVMMASLNFIRNESLTLVECTLLALAIVSLVLSAIGVTAAVNVRKGYGLFLDDLIQANKGKIAIVKRSKRKSVEQLYHLGKLNQKATAIIANYVDASYVGIRNSIILIAAFFGAVLFRLFLKH